MQVYRTENEFGAGEVRSWASIIDDATLAQAQAISRSPIVTGHVAVMPDAHYGIGACVGSAIPTKGGILPAAVGVDIGCGMIAAQTDLERAAIDAHGARTLLGRIRKAIPADVHQRGSGYPDAWKTFADTHGHAPGADDRIRAKAEEQFGTLGSGNHFAEVAQDADGAVWLIVHSGSRGPGNMLANRHIRRAAEFCEREGLKVEGRDLSFLMEGTPEFDDYIADMLWAQDYALWQRRAMMSGMLAALAAEHRFDVKREISCHHNYSTRWDVGEGEAKADGVILSEAKDLRHRSLAARHPEPVEGRRAGDQTWLSRKGAIAANAGDLGVIPGSMGAATHIVEGLGNPDAYHTAPHGAGRLRSRGAARRELSLEEFKQQMGDRTWQDRDAPKLLDEAPGAYKPIDVVMNDARDLVKTLTVLSQFVNYKGV